jgi:hypothetical protein
MTENNNIFTGSIGSAIGFISNINGAEISKTIIFAFIGGFVSIAGKELFLYLKNKYNEKY